MFSHEQLLSILSTMPDPAFILTRGGRYAAVFGGTDERYYHDGSSLVGQSMYDVLKQEKADWFCEQIALALDNRKLHVVEYTLSGSDIKGLESAGPDQPIWFEGRVQALEFQVDGEDAVIWVASNITEKNAIETRLRELSEMDSLTGLYNRRKFLEVLSERFADVSDESTPMAALMFDVDNFKDINDSLGHQKGDAVLREIGRICREALRGTDIVARLGGDEFVFLMPGMTSADALPRANLLRLLVAQGLTEALDLNVTISGGLSQFGAADENEDDVLIRADEGLYQSKRDGRNCISLVHPPIAQTTARAAV